MAGVPSGARPRLRGLPVFSFQAWQMSYGERVALEGMLVQIKPRLAIEIGRAEGGSLRRIAAHSDAVISLDLVEPPPDILELPNVTALSGDSHAMLPVELERLADQGLGVDFVLVDGDHSAEGVRRDMEDLLRARAVDRTVIIAHDSLNQEVRRGLDAVDYAAYEKVAWVDMDFVPGYVARIPERRGECWGGLALVVVDSSGDFRSGDAVRNTMFVELSSLVWPAAAAAREGSSDDIREVELVSSAALVSSNREVEALRAELDQARHWLEAIQTSLSWRLTQPLRAIKRHLRV
jgi:hypothetical protein